MYIVCEHIKKAPLRQGVHLWCRKAGFFFTYSPLPSLPPVSSAPPLGSLIPTTLTLTLTVTPPFPITVQRCRLRLPGRRSAWHLCVLALRGLRAPDGNQRYGRERHREGECMCGNCVCSCLCPRGHGLSEKWCVRKRQLTILDVHSPSPPAAFSLLLRPPRTGR